MPPTTTSTKTKYYITAASSKGNNGKKKQAKCNANQDAIDRLYVKKESSMNSRYTMSLQRAIDSVANCTEPITTHKQALNLKYVGTHCATIICPPNANENTEENKKLKRQKIIQATSSVSSSNQSSPASLSTLGSTKKNNKKTSSTTTNVNNTKKRQKTQKQALLSAILEEDNNGGENNNNNNNNNNNSNKPTTILTKKEKEYQKAVEFATTWKTQYSKTNLQWRIVLIIDGREQKSNHIIAKCQMSGIPCIERHLPIGDMAWIIQGMVPTTTNTKTNKSNNNNNVVIELMVGTIIERKTPEDLKASLFGTRYMEQRLRLKNSGLQQILFLIEGDITKENLFNCPADTLHSAIWETRIHLGFSIIHTAHMDETVLTLKRIHRRLLQRTFPREFGKDNSCTNGLLPIFGEITHRQQDQQQQSITNKKNRRQRRIQSLTEMTFDTDPVPPQSSSGTTTTRFITYDELKCKIERDREMGTKTIGCIHLAMLKQVATLSDTKCHIIAQHYKTPNEMFMAMEQVDCEKNFANIPTNHNKSSKNTKLGPRSATEIKIAYGIDDPNREPIILPNNDNNNDINNNDNDDLPTNIHIAAAASTSAVTNYNTSNNDNTSPLHNNAFSQDITSLDSSPENGKQLFGNGIGNTKQSTRTTVATGNNNVKAGKSAAATTKRRRLNTSLGSLFSKDDSSDDDDDDDDEEDRKLPAIKTKATNRKVNCSLTSNKNGSSCNNNNTTDYKKRNYNVEKKDYHHNNDILSIPSSTCSENDDEEEEQQMQRITTTKQTTTSTKKRRRRCLNTSLGSLLNSSDDDDDLLFGSGTATRQQRTTTTTTTMMMADPTVVTKTVSTDSNISTITGNNNTSSRKKQQLKQYNDAADDDSVIEID